jgi:hypothetical protein
MIIIEHMYGFVKPGRFGEYLIPRSHDDRLLLLRLLVCVPASHPPGPPSRWLCTDREGGRLIGRGRAGAERLHNPSALTLNEQTAARDTERSPPGGYSWSAGVRGIIAPLMEAWLA